jgi:hypothetical protein
MSRPSRNAPRLFGNEKPLIRLVKSGVVMVKLPAGLWKNAERFGIEIERSGVNRFGSGKKTGRATLTAAFRFRLVSPGVNSGKRYR